MSAAACRASFFPLKGSWPPRTGGDSTGSTSEGKQREHGPSFLCCASTWVQDPHTPTVFPRRFSLSTGLGEGVGFGSRRWDRQEQLYL